MSRFKHYDLNPETLMYEIAQVPLNRRLAKLAVVFVVSLLLAFLYFWIYVGVLGNDSPKLAILKARNASWHSKVAVLNRNMDQYEEALASLEMRNEDVYRSIFGMNSIPQDILGDGPADRYAFLDGAGVNSTLKKTYVRLDRLAKRTFVGSKSFDEVSVLAQRAGDMASCIPAIPPLDPSPRVSSVSSPFGGRRDPIYGSFRMHSGVDFSAKTGTPVYATGDGVVESVKFQLFGYGNILTIDHGFGYKTNYAHLNNIYVVEGMSLKRGECIGAVGSSGKATGPHLHYEVEYKGNKINPYNFYDLSMSSAEYATLVKKRENDTEVIQRPQFRVKTR